MFVKSSLHLIVVLLIMFLIFAFVAKIDTSLEIQKRKKALYNKTKKTKK